VPIKTGFCASSVCISLLKHVLKLKRNTVEPIIIIAHCTYFRLLYGWCTLLEAVWIGSDEGVSSEVRGSTPPYGGLYNILIIPLHMPVDTCNPACTDLLMNSDHEGKSGQSDLVYCVYKL